MTSWKTEKSGPSGTDKETGMENVERASSLPGSVFSACDALVEAELEASVANVFLKYMATECIPISEPTDLGRPRDSVSSTDIRAFLDAEAERELVTAPQLDCGLDPERIWVLADLTLNGSGLSRHRATLKLREFIDELWSSTDLDPALLLQMMEMIKTHEKNGAMSMLMHILLLAVTSAYDRQGTETAPHGEEEAVGPS